MKTIILILLFAPIVANAADIISTPTNVEYNVQRALDAQRAWEYAHETTIPTVGGGYYGQPYYPNSTTIINNNSATINAPVTPMFGVK